MRTYLECIPCFFRQAIEAAQMAGADEKTQKSIIDELARKIPELPLDSKPPEMGLIIHRLIKEKTGMADPYFKVKQQSNKIAQKFV